LTYHIVPIAEAHIAGFRDAVDVVARESKYLAFLEAPPLEDVTRFVRNNIERGYPQFVVVSAGTVVGWCDVLPNRTRVIYSHCGTLGIGLLPEFRGKGIGRELMRRAIDAALRSASPASNWPSGKTTPMPSLCTKASALKSRDVTAMPSALRGSTRTYTRWPC